MGNGPSVLKRGGKPNSGASASAGSSVNAKPHAGNPGVPLTIPTSRQPMTSHEDDVSGNASLFVTLLRSSLAAFNAASDVFPPLKSATGGALWIIDEISKYKDNKTEWGDFAHDLQFEMANIIATAKIQNRRSRNFGENLEELDKYVSSSHIYMCAIRACSAMGVPRVIQTIREHLEVTRERRGPRAFLQYLQHGDDIKTYKERFNKALLRFNLKATILSHDDIAALLQDTEGLKAWATSTNSMLQALAQGQQDILTRLEDAEVRELLNELRKQSVEGASGSVNQFCQDGTRTSTLHQITTFLDGGTSEPLQDVFLLVGTAGSGKSTIAHSCRKHFAEHKKFRLASFFFDAKYADRKSATRVVGHLANALVGMHPEVDNAMALALKQHRDLMCTDLETQFRELIRIPLSLLPLDAKPVVIIVDALDEADGSPPRSHGQLSIQDAYFDDLVRVFAQENLPPRVRILITARDYPEIVASFKGKPHIFLQRLQLDSDAVNDVRVFAGTRLQAISTIRGLPQWPSEDQLEVFAQKAGGLFIWGHLALAWIEFAPNPKRELELLLLSHTPSKATDRINDIYALILSRSPWEYGEFSGLYREILGAILCLRRPLTVSALADLIGKSARDVAYTVQKLAPILSNNDRVDTPITITHESVRDYITICASTRPDEARFAISPGNTDDWLAERCINIMDENISDEWVLLITSPEYQAPGSDRKPSTLVSGEIKSDVMYAIDFWHEHTSLERLPSLLDARGHPHFITKWQASYLIKLADISKGRRIDKLLQTQLAGGFLTIGIGGPKDSSTSISLPLPLEALVRTIVQVGMKYDNAYLATWIEQQPTYLTSIVSRTQQEAWVLAALSVTNPEEAALADIKRTQGGIAQFNQMIAKSHLEGQELRGLAETLLQHPDTGTKLMALKESGFSFAETRGRLQEMAKLYTGEPALEAARPN
ncbi:hypothetical protein DL93DRAFT_2230219 [Clavulina sp. PMI_390]|nr:hypothetical protein DL93DRAFT_2230219 [Clavulina sp. PMI_390]